MLVLRNQVMDYATSHQAWATTVRFIEKHARSEPSKNEMVAFLSLLSDDSLRAALGIASASKYNMKIKPRSWQQDGNRLLTVCYLCYTANEEGE